MFRRLLLVVALAVFRADALSALHVAKYASPFRWSTPILGSDRPTCLHPLEPAIETVDASTENSESEERRCKNFGTPQCSGKCELARTENHQRR
jgi:hypothetical protein